MHNYRRENCGKRPRGPRITIIDTALIDTGMQNYEYLKRTPGDRVACGANQSDECYIMISDLYRRNYLYIRYYMIFDINMRKYGFFRNECLLRSYNQSHSVIFTMTSVIRACPYVFLMNYIIARLLPFYLQDHSNIIFLIRTI